MAIYPCDIRSHRYPGAQQTMYVALVNGISSSRRKLRLCPEHFSTALGRLEDHAHNGQTSFDDASTTACFSCGKDVEEGTWQFFSTVYASKAERADFWAVVHDDCAAAVLEDWDLPVDTP